MKDYPMLSPKRTRKRQKRNPHKLSLREALKNKKLSERIEHGEKEVDEQNKLTHQEVLTTIAEWKRKTDIECIVRIGDGIITIRFCDPPY